MKTILLLLTCSIAFAQSFEVVAIKPAQRLTPATMDNFHFVHDDSRYENSNIYMRDLLAQAWGIPRYQISAPDWIDDVQYSITAKLPDGSTKVDTPRMMRSMLVERFKAVAHTEQKQQPVLFVEGSAAKLEPTAKPDDNGGCMGRPGFYQCHSTTILRLAEFMSQLARNQQTQPAGAPDRGFDVTVPVIDRTGLTGKYDFEIRWAMAPGTEGRGGQIVPGDPTAKAGSLKQAIEALGLHLQTGKAPFDYLVVDHLERNPTEN